MAIAKKEFSDKLYEKSTILLSILFFGTLFAFTQNNSNFGDIAQVIAVFFPILGIALGYDAIVAERKSNSLNVLLTHPVFRDKIITGKLIGLSLNVLCIVFLSLTLIIASDLLLTGKTANFESMLRLYIFGAFTFLYLMTFLSLGILTSILCKSEILSLALGVAVWINLCFALGLSILALTGFITGESMFDMSQKFRSTGSALFYLSPIHHFSKVTLGKQDLSYGGYNFNSDINGFLDTRYSLSYLSGYYIGDIIFLLVIPILLQILSYIAFLRDDIRG